MQKENRVSDQFSEWDKLMKAWDTTITIEGGYQRYKARRQKKERQAAAKKGRETRIRNKAGAKQG
jgi:hypothetical protein